MDKKHRLIGSKLVRSKEIVNTFDQPKSDDKQKFESDDLYTMKLNDTMYLDDFSITRVPGGWIYRFTEMHYNNGSPINGSESSVLVPYSNIIPGG
jgi:hypothetical protein